MKAKLTALEGRTLTIRLESDFQQRFRELQGYEVDVEIRRYYPNRSTSANAYAWSLMRKMASKTGRDVQEIYREYLRTHGAKVTTERVRLENAADEIEGFVKGHIGRYVEYDDSDADSGYIEIIRHYGSSDFDRQQFAEFLDNIIEDCRLLHIETGDRP